MLLSLSTVQLACSRLSPSLSAVAPPLLTRCGLLPLLMLWLRLSPRRPTATLFYLIATHTPSPQAYGQTTYLITTLQRVPRGTEGAVSAEGTLAGAAAALLFSLVALGVGQVRALRWHVVLCLGAHTSNSWAWARCVACLCRSHALFSRPGRAQRAQRQRQLLLKVPNPER